MIIQHGLLPNAYFTSGLIRAQCTLDPMLAEMGVVVVIMTRHQTLNERRCGELAGPNRDEALSRWGEERRSYDVPPPGGDSLK